jgi:hypothetical protein
MKLKLYLGLTAIAFTMEAYAQVDVKIGQNGFFVRY